MSTLHHVSLIISIIVIFNMPTIISTTTNATCTTTKCSSMAPLIRFPFRLKTNQTRRCGYPGFDLICNEQIGVILSLPQSGDFLVLDINYVAQTLKITDPDNCLPKRFMTSFNLSGSPFKVTSYEDYTFLNCSLNATLPLLWRNFRCLGGEDYKVVVGRGTNFSIPSCVALPPIFVPMPWLYWADDNNAMQLMWSEPSCGVKCEMNGESCGFLNDAGLDVGCVNSGSSAGHGIARSVKYGLIFGLLVPGLLSIIGVSIFIFIKYKRHQTATGFNTLTPSPEPPRRLGFGDTTIAAFPKRLLGESRRLPRASNNACPICLSEYKPKESLRIIPDCKHYFHAQCIDEWLKMDGSCPVCRSKP